MSPEESLLIRVLAWRRSGRAEQISELAHAVGEPLASIRGFAEALQVVARDGKPFPAERIQARMGEIIAETDAIDALLQEMRSIDRTPGPGTSDPAHAVATVLRFQAKRLRSHGIDCQLTRAGTPARTGIPPEDLQEVVRILLANAQDACRRRHGRGGRIAISVDATGDPILLSLADDGCGMEPSVLQRAGEPGFSTKPDGAGLGLAVARALLAVWDGHLELASTPGVGTVMTVRLHREQMHAPR